jgi:hypothetical protein
MDRVKPELSRLSMLIRTASMDASGCIREIRLLLGDSDDLDLEALERSIDELDYERAATHLNQLMLKLNILLPGAGK